MTIRSVRSAVLLGVALVSVGCGRQESGPVPAASSVPAAPSPGQTPGRNVGLTRDTSAAAGIGVTKTCPTSAQVAGVPFNCSFTVANQDTANSVTGLSVTNTVPCPDPPACKGGSTAAVPCLVNGVPVTTLEPAGNPGSSCSGTLRESTPDCSAGSLGDFVQASGNDGGQLGGGAAHSVPIVPCTTSPKNKPTK